MHKSHILKFSVGSYKDEIDEDYMAFLHKCMNCLMVHLAMELKNSDGDISSVLLENPLYYPMLSEAFKHNSLRDILSSSCDHEDLILLSDVGHYISDYLNRCYNKSFINIVSCTMTSNYELMITVKWSKKHAKQQRGYTVTRF